MSRFVELTRQVCRGNRHTNTLSKSLTERTRCDLNTWSKPILGMAWCLTTKLAEVLDLIERKIIACQMQQRIKEHGTMSTGKDEAVTSRPFRVARIVAQMTCPQSESHWRRAHRKSRVTGVCLLNGICGEKTDGIDRTH